MTFLEVEYQKNSMS